jgi:Phage P22-like portal protein
MIPEQTQYAELLVRARRRYKQAVEAETLNRVQSSIDLEFISGSQWNEKIRVARESGPSPRPCLVFNKVLPPVTQLGNQARQNKPAVQVNPVDSAGDIDTARVLGGMIRHIEYDSDADNAYDTALFYAAAMGFGYWRYGCEYTAPDSFDQDLKVITVNDPFSIYLDCFAVKPDRSDMKWAFVVDRMPDDVFTERFGKDAADLSADFDQEGLQEEGWFDDGGKRVAEYWEIEGVPRTLRLRKDPDGTVHPVYLEDLKVEEPGEPGKRPTRRKLTSEEIDAMDWVREDPDDEESAPKEREVEIPVVMTYIINGAKVLEKPTDWPGTTIPIVIVTGLEMTVRGQKKVFSMTRFARDPQQLYNWYKTMEAETASLAPKPKWVGAVGQFKTKIRDWKRANIDNAAFLEYDPIAVGDKQVEAPQWRVFDPPVQALTIGAAAAADDIKSATGYFDPSLGQVKGDQSGIAIKSLQKQGDISNFHFLDNLARGMKRGGRILIEQIPYRYDTAREVRIIGEDKKQEVIKVNAPGVDKKGKAYHHKLDLGKYDLCVMQGPSYETARIEGFEQLTDLAEKNPQVMQYGGDIILENSDIIGADRIARRLHKMLPPALQSDDEDGDTPPTPEQVAALKQQLQAVTQQNQQLIGIVKGKMLEIQAKNESSERIAQQRVESTERIADQTNRVKIDSAMALSKSAQLNALAKMDYDSVQAELDRRNAYLLSNMDVEAAAQADAAEHAQANQSQQSAQQHEQAMAQGVQAHEQAMQGQDAQAAQQLQQGDQAHAQQLQQDQQQHAQQLAQQAQDAQATQQQVAIKAQPKPVAVAKKKTAAKPKPKKAA